MMLKKIFGDCRIVALAGEKNSGKTNNLIAMLKDYKKAPIYAYGLPKEAIDYLGAKEISSLRQLVHKRDCVIVLDEFQKLRLNDRRYKDELNDFVDFVYHNNVYVILCSPNIREFNTIIGSVIEKWLLKNVALDMCVNGSQLKKVINGYKGRYKVLNAIDIPKNELLVINNEEEIVLKLPYIKEIDNKKDNKEIL